MKKTVLKKPTKTFTMFTPQIRSRHPSHRPLKTASMERLPFRSVVRLGSTTPLSEIPNGIGRIELNTVEAIKTSSNKLLMKRAFKSAQASTAPWCEHTEIREVNAEGIQLNLSESGASIPFPIVAKAKYGSKGQGNTLIKSLEEYNAWRTGKTMANYIFEKFVNYALEYRLHISKEGCFYACRKALKSDCPEDQKWRHHDDTCVWFMEHNEDGTPSENFRKPNSWNTIIEHCKAALEAIGADILAFDVKVQSGANNKGKARETQDFILLESNSAPSFGDVTLQKYITQIPIVLKRKFKERG